jgi:5'-3' exonuclease
MSWDNTTEVTVLIDFSNYAHTCWWPAVAANKADPKYDTVQVFKNNLEAKLVTISLALEGNFMKAIRTIFVEDRVAKGKLEIYPLYKANREKDPEQIDFKSIALEHVRSIWPYAIWAHSPDNEADDAIAAIASKKELGHFVICSSDKDLWQLTNERVSVFRLTACKFLEPPDIIKEFELSFPSHIALYKALWGDSGDNVKNVVPRMQKQLLPIMASCDGSLARFLDKYNEACQVGVLTKRCMQLVDENEQSIRLNWKLVKLNPDVPVILEIAKDSNESAPPAAQAP